MPNMTWISACSGYARPRLAVGRRPPPPMARIDGFFDGMTSRKKYRTLSFHLEPLERSGGDRRPLRTLNYPSQQWRRATTWRGWLARNRSRFEFKRNIVTVCEDRELLRRASQLFLCISSCRDIIKLYTAGCLTGMDNVLDFTHWHPGQVH